MPALLSPSLSLSPGLPGEHTLLPAGKPGVQPSAWSGTAGERAGVWAAQGQALTGSAEGRCEVGVLLGHGGVPRAQRAAMLCPGLGSALPPQPPTPRSWRGVALVRFTLSQAGNGLRNLQGLWLPGHIRCVSSLLIPAFGTWWRSPVTQECPALCGGVSALFSGHRLPLVLFSHRS